jgi:hypothetical protein
VAEGQAFNIEHALFLRHRTKVLICTVIIRETIQERAPSPLENDRAKSLMRKIVQRRITLESLDHTNLHLMDQMMTIIL